MLTAGDVVNRLIDYVGSNQASDGLALSKARRAMQDAVRVFSGMYHWNWFKQIGRIDLLAWQDSGTIAYDPTVNIVTLAGATWPSYAASGMLRNGSVVARVSSLIDATHLRLDPNYTFPSIVAGGAAYRLYFDRYHLPSDFAAMLTPYREDWWGGLRYTPPSGWLYGTRGDDTTGIPATFTIMPSPAGGFDLLVRPSPNESRTLDFVYCRSMRPVQFDVGLNQGTLTVSNDGLTVTCTKSLFMPAMIGSIIRITNNALVPELRGVVIQETPIAAVPSATSLTLSSPCPLVNTAGLGYTISDPIDVEPLAMATCFQWLAMRTLAVETGSKASAAIAAEFDDSLNTAKCADARYAGPDRAGPRHGGLANRWQGPSVTEVM